eukprot:TRINITY_DN10789_c0_g3_i2.p1 TRINITY_DN10789_c0_g3~~TRINITY_DN10789_c0_g3_i2.p1  ORF type:complete len:187 (+),score=7.85 TRINITY_DN10789_c0_g3_i2:201-761(+)
MNICKNKGALLGCKSEYWNLRGVHGKRQTLFSLRSKASLPIALSPLERAGILYREKVSQQKLRRLCVKDHSLNEDKHEIYYTFEEWMTEKLSRDLRELKELSCVAANLKLHPLFDSPLDQLRKLRSHCPQGIEIKYNRIRHRRVITANPEHYKGQNRLRFGMRTRCNSTEAKVLKVKPRSRLASWM